MSEQRCPNGHPTGMSNPCGLGICVLTELGVSDVGREARWIRVLRVELGCTWARIGELIEQVSGIRAHHSHGEHGMWLCRWAADVLGEDPKSWDE